MKHHVHQDDLPWTEIRGQGAYQGKRRRLGHAAGGRELGCSLIELPPGSKSWPRHAHLGNEEALYVLEGEGELRLGDERVPLSPGVYASFLAGPEHAHQVENTSSAPLRYLCMSTMNEPEIALYADSGKLFVCAGAPPGGDKTKRTFEGIYLQDARVDYWQGEDED